jgi:hypothetical protein
MGIGILLIIAIGLAEGWNATNGKEIVEKIAPLIV